MLKRLGHNDIYPSITVIVGFNLSRLVLVQFISGASRVFRDGLCSGEHSMGPAAQSEVECTRCGVSGKLECGSSATLLTVIVVNYAVDACLSRATNAIWRGTRSVGNVSWC